MRDGVIHVVMGNSVFIETPVTSLSISLTFYNQYGCEIVFTPAWLPDANVVENSLVSCMSFEAVLLVLAVPKHSEVPFHVATDNYSP